MAFYERKEKNYNNKRNSFNQKQKYSDNRRSRKTRERINYKMIEIPMGCSEYYNEKIPQLFDILVSIPFDKIKFKISIPVENGKNNEYKSKPNYIHTGWIKEFDAGHMSFKVSVPENVIEMLSDCVLIPNVIKTKENEEEIIQAITGQFNVNYDAEKYGEVFNEVNE